LAGIRTATGTPRPTSSRPPSLPLNGFGAASKAASSMNELHLERHHIMPNKKRQGFQGQLVPGKDAQEQRLHFAPGNSGCTVPCRARRGQSTRETLTPNPRAREWGLLRVMPVQEIKKER
jgi:hypothetical protein